MRSWRALVLGAVVSAVAAIVCCGSASLGFAWGSAGRRAPRLVRLTSEGAPFASRLLRASRGGEASEGFSVGDKVQAVCPDDEQRYPGTVDGVNDDGTFLVRWDDPDGGPETHDIKPALMEKVIIFRDYVVGDDVQAIAPDDGQWYPGSVAAVNADGTFQVRWDDPDGGPETHAVQAEGMKKVTVFKDYKAGEAVEAVYPDDGQMYAGSVLKANDDGTFQVKWDDPDGGPADSAVKPKDMKYPPIAFDKLEVGQKYTGTVRSVHNYGAFVDFGAEEEGLVHISKVAKRRVTNIHDYLEVDQEVEVWVSQLRDDGKVSLTMVKSKIGKGGPRSTDVSAFAGVPPDAWLDGIVERLAPYGAFVSVRPPGGGAAMDGLLHMTDIRDGYVEFVEDELHVGQRVKVRVSVDAERGRLNLSMRKPEP